MLIDVFVFILGLFAGSFLTVCIYRIPLEKPVLAPSTCPGCGSGIKAKDRIPVFSYILLKGRCKSCKARISLQYPIVELLTGFVWLLIYRRYGLSFETLALIFLFSVLIPAAFIDFTHFIIPNGLVLIGLAGGAAVFLYHVLYKPYLLYGSDLWYAPLIGMISASGPLFVIAVVALLIYKDDGAMGMGDVKIFLPIGIFLGARLALLALFMAVILAGLVSLVLLIFHVFSRKSAIPLGPFIVASAFIAVLLGPRLFTI